MFWGCLGTLLTRGRKGGGGKQPEQSSLEVWDEFIFQISQYHGRWSDSISKDCLEAHKTISYTTSERCIQLESHQAAGGNPWAKKGLEFTDGEERDVAPTEGAGYWKINISSYFRRVSNSQDTLLISILFQFTQVSRNTYKTTKHRSDLHAISSAAH